MEKIKPLLPSLREKKRYVAFEVFSEKPVNFKQASETIINSVLKIAGLKGMAEMGLIILKDRYSKNKGIIRVSAKSINALKASFCLAKSINDQPIILRSLGVSGVLQKMDKCLAS